MEVKRAYTFRFYPTPVQEQTLARIFGCVRFAYNHMLRLRTEAWGKEQKRVGYHETSARLTALKKTPEHAWLNEVSSVPVQQALRHLQTAFNNFFAKHVAAPGRCRCKPSARKMRPPRGHQRSAQCVNRRAGGGVP